MMKAEQAGSGLRTILIATAIAGVFGYAIQLLAPILLDNDAAYVAFSVYWSVLYLCVAALSGVQQEITRAVRPADDVPSPAPVLRRFTLIAIATAVGVLVVVAVFVGPLVLPGPTVFLVGALLLGVVGYILLAVLSGVLYGMRRWKAIAWLTSLDVSIRAVLVIFALASGWETQWIALMVSLPFGFAVLAVWVGTRRDILGAVGVDVSLGRLLSHSTGTIVAAASLGVMMNGLPMLLGTTARATEASLLAGLILAITVTRAPLIVPIMALQSYMISIFRGAGSRMLRRIFIALAGASVGVVLLAWLAAAVGPWAIEVVSGGRFQIDGIMMAVITASGGIVAMMCLTGPVLVSYRQHVAYATGWAVAALLTVGGLMLPLELSLRLSLALLVPPLVGLGAHAASLVWGARARSRSDSAREHVIPS